MWPAGKFVSKKTLIVAAIKTQVNLFGQSNH